MLYIQQQQQHRLLVQQEKSWLRSSFGSFCGERGWLQELEKFKFVLDYKIKELKKQIEPREKEVEEMKKKVRDMDTELQRYHRTNAALNLSISEQKLKLDALQSECARQARKSADKDAIIKNFIHDLQETCDHIQVGDWEWMIDVELGRGRKVCRIMRWEDCIHKRDVIDTPLFLRIVYQTT